MDAILESCAGLDVHKKTVTVCVRRLGADRGVRAETKTFGTMTRDLRALAEWLKAHQVTHVAMESTGVYWKPVYNLLEGRFEVLLCNAQHIKQVPGRKTDVKDCEWIAQLLQHGLLRGSLIPPRAQREIRDLTRHRVQVTEEKTRIANRIQKVLEDANIKLGSVATDVLGVSGRAMLEGLLRGEEPGHLAETEARGRLREKIPQLRLALEGHVSDHHRYMLRSLFKHLHFLEGEIADLDRRVEEVMARADQEGATPLPFGPAIQLVKTIPGIHQRTAETLMAEIGTDMSRFPTARHLASWAGLCPGNHESAGKRKQGRPAKGSRWLRRGLTQAAWVAARLKGTYLGAQYRRLAGRRGKKRAVTAVAHSLLVIVYAMLSRGTPYHDLGPEHFDRLSPDRLTRYYVRRLRELGHDVVLDPAA